MDKLICNMVMSGKCTQGSCPHAVPHYSHPVPGSSPHCEDEGTYCYLIEQHVNCVPVGETRRTFIRRWCPECRKTTHWLRMTDGTDKLLCLECRLRELETTGSAPLTTRSVVSE